jgi:hypothetical protein
MRGSLSEYRILLAEVLVGGNGHFLLVFAGASSEYQKKMRFSGAPRVSPAAQQAFLHLLHTCIVAPANPVASTTTPNQQWS